MIMLVNGAWLQFLILIQVQFSGIQQHGMPSMTSSALQHLWFCFPQCSKRLAPTERGQTFPADGVQCQTELLLGMTSTNAANSNSLKLKKAEEIWRRVRSKVVLRLFGPSVSAVSFLQDPHLFQLLCVIGERVERSLFRRKVRTLFPLGPLCNLMDDPSDPAMTSAVSDRLQREEAVHCDFFHEEFLKGVGRVLVQTVATGRGEAELNCKREGRHLHPCARWVHYGSADYNQLLEGVPSEFKIKHLLSHFAFSISHPSMRSQPGPAAGFSRAQKEEQEKAQCTAEYKHERVYSEQALQPLDEEDS
ncbi:hypothetical protein MHYP_G00070850 [Metynnis hypsauchen]